MSLQAGKQGTATATFNNPLPTGATIVWSSDDTNIATVAGGTVVAGSTSNSATVTAVAAGSCNISCTVTNPDGVLAKGFAPQTVTPAPPPDVTTVTVVVP